MLSNYDPAEVVVQAVDEAFAIAWRQFLENFPPALLVFQCNHAVSPVD
ncbi:hypothetical protein [Noviherbaspirillum sp.]|nr:hypothetical protein [Noviherbaspirillum sp.]HJV79841.1 hypothetical protein [Noviherbaspirillum sp.]